MSNTLTHTLWREKYRPQTLDEYVGNDDIKGKISKWLADGEIPDLLLYGEAGTGKTTAAKIIGKHLDADVLYINASDENSVDTIREKIKGFASTSGFKRWKLIILDEADFMTQNAMAALRNIIETFSKTTRFILTCNHVEKIIPAIRSRLVEFDVHPPDKKSVALRVKYILETEGIEFDIKDLGAIVNQFYPDQRKIISTLQRNSGTGKLIVDNDIKVISGYCDKILEELKLNVKNPKQCFKNIRQIIADSKVRTFDDLFRFLFDNLDEYAPDGKKANIIQCLAEFQFKMGNVVDKEIQCAAMFVQMLNELQ